ncbi:hypothetical protein MF406_11685 [Georgenia sp. TF02-10]|uniref:hypothetical protein n=1 Tax=Georgenia sp. TF02-10 TaxID=2917725 RepID=UPI001FA6E7D5|nr:hypothetical protein [Georgenia sp. TF02-10]UNX53649.1 hypothetical protein MF406_11685 [Georgenia sp. TF02-10]
MRRRTDDQPDLAPGRGDAGHAGRAEGRLQNPVGWTGLLLAVALTVWEAIYNFNVVASDVVSGDVQTSVNLFVCLVVGLAAVVLGIVAIAQRRRPVWPGLVALGVGLNGFLIGVAAWLGGLQGG